jgi:hypothetical protein
MRISPAHFGALGWLCLALALALAAPNGCGGTPGSHNASGDEGGSGTLDGSGGGDRSVDANDAGDDGDGDNLVVTDSSPSSANDSSSSGPPCGWGGVPTAGQVVFPGCQGCTFPGCNAMPCAADTPAIKVVYPPDNVLLPPNMNVLSVHWTPSGAPFQRFDVDFNSPPNTDWHILTKCANPTIDSQSGSQSGGCELTVDPVSWSKLVSANRGGDPITVTVRGTTDGVCASTSVNSVHVSIADEDLVGTYYYWKSTTSPNGVGGQIVRKEFGNLTTSEEDVTSAIIPNASCNGCHAVSRDGSRMVVYSDDDDSDDQYSDIGGSLVDLTAAPAIELPGGVTGMRMGGQPPGLSAFHPLASSYLTSNGLPLTLAGTPDGGSTSAGYPSAVAANSFSLWSGQTGAFVGAVAAGPSSVRPAMPDWSADGNMIVYVQPLEIPIWDEDAAAPRRDDDHVFGGSLFTVPYTGNGTFGTPSVFLQSAGENNYYPSYSPDVPMSAVLFNRAPLDPSVATLTGCSGGHCPNDSFANPAARLMLVPNRVGSTPIDLERANGSTLAAPVPLSNSYPRWTPFVQTYRGQKLVWFTFSSTRDYGLRVLNHKAGMYPCYPPDSYELPGAIHGQPFAAGCQQPQLWMAAINLSGAQGGVDPSTPAFWIPYQDSTTHNHMAQWTQQAQLPPPVAGCTCSMVYGPCGTANGGCGCCPGQGLACGGSQKCFVLPP